MNTPTNLRRTLEEHVHYLDPITSVDRLGQVRDRIRVVRRRRRAGVAGVAAAVVALAGGAFLVPHVNRVDPAAARKDLAGHTAPATMDSLGFGYSFTKAVEGDQRVELKVPAIDAPRLVTWAGSAGPVRLRGWFDSAVDDNQDRLTSDATDFSEFQYVAPGEAVDFVATSVKQGEVALAVYDLDPLPAADSTDGIFYRQEVAGGRLIASAIGERGQAELTVPFTMPAGELATREFCSGVSDDHWLWVEIGAGGARGGSCGQRDPFDPGASAGLSREGWRHADGRLIQPGEQVTARVWLSQGRGPDNGEAPVTQAPGVRLGLGLYADPDPVRTIGDWLLPALKEYNGHLYAYRDAVVSARGATSLSRTVAAGTTPVLVEHLTSNLADGELGIFVDGARVLTRGSYIGGGGGSLLEFGVIRDSSAVFRIAGRSAIGPRTILGIVTYERVD